MNKKKSYILFFVLFISIGFAYLSTNLTINGIIGYSKGTWNIYFANIEVAENSVEATTPVVENNTTINLDCTFKEPSEFYEFSVDIINAGTIDAVLDELLKTGITSENEDYLSLTVTYYNGDAISSNDLLRMGTSTRIKVRVEYIYDIDELPSPTEISLSISANYKNVDLKEASYDRNVWNYDYLGAEQVFIVPKDGNYKLETWGAQGGDAGTYAGGYGAYSSGKIHLSKDSRLYVNVGSKPLTAAQNSIAAGGYNGGAIAITSGEDIAGSGGGATSITLVAKELKELLDNKNQVIIVAGAGGGAYSLGTRFSSSGGSAGGVTGSLAPWDGFCESSRTQVNGNKSTQLIGGTSSSCAGSLVNDAGGFGYGGFIESTESQTNLRWFAGGGSGWYGGGAGYAHGANGGSSYIGYDSLYDGVMYCYECEESSAESTKTVSTTNVSNQAISQYAKRGNGYARITLIG